MFTPESNETTLTPKDLAKMGADLMRAEEKLGQTRAAMDKAYNEFCQSVTDQNLSALIKLQCDYRGDKSAWFRVSRQLDYLQRRVTPALLDLEP